MFVCNPDSLVFINGSYIDVFGSVTFAILNCSLTPGKWVFIYIFGILARTSEDGERNTSEDIDVTAINENK
jgi:hypothetical protein